MWTSIPPVASFPQLGAVLAPHRVMPGGVIRRIRRPAHPNGHEERVGRGRVSEFFSITRHRVANPTEKGRSLQHPSLKYERSRPRSP